VAPGDVRSIAELKVAAAQLTQHWAVTGLWTEGIVALTLGAVAIIGSTGIEHDALASTVFALGAIVAVNGAVMCFVPAPANILISGVVYALLFPLFFLLLVFLNEAGLQLTTSGVLLSMVLGSALLAWIYQRVKQYARLPRDEYQPVDEAVGEYLTHLIQVVREADPQQSSSAIEFFAVYGNSWGVTERWKARLFEGFGLFLQERVEMIVVTPMELAVKRVRGDLSRTKHRLHVGKMKCAAEIEQVFIDRIIAWKASHSRFEAGPRRTS
jgi:hypothetical protein